MKNNERKVAILSDIHGLYEPTVAVLNDIAKRGITEIYSLGDNIGLGPNPNEVVNILLEHNVKMIAGEDEEYLRLGFDSFNYVSEFNKLNYLWTMEKLTDSNLDFLNDLPCSYDLELGGKLIALCHFANDVRFDFHFHNIWTYKANYDRGIAYRQFFYTNSSEQKEEIIYRINRLGYDNPKVKGILSALANPLFEGKNIRVYDALFQGHLHSFFHECADNIDFYSINRVCSSCDKDYCASYVILTETDNGYKYEEVLVHFDIQKMYDSINKSSIPNNIPIKMMTRY